MTIRTSKQAIAVALGQTRNVPGMCQMTTRSWYNADSAGDQDRDGDNDAVDGWLSEPRSARHEGDRNPPLGKPLSFKGGSKGNGHRAMSVVTNGIRSTDMSNNRYKAGITSTVTGSSMSDAIRKIELSMGVTYLGWSDTIDGFTIPKEPDAVPKPVVKKAKRKFAHFSGQYNDSSPQHTADLEKVFDQGFHHITGTEAGPGSGNMNAEIERCAEKFGYLLALTTRYDTWVAVKKSLVVPGSFKKGATLAVDRSSMWTPKPPGGWGDKGIVWAQYRDRDLGNISIGSIHPLTWRGAGETIKKLSDAAYMAKTDAWGKSHGKGPDLAFIAGDLNKDDRRQDVFLQAPFTTCWDELQVWPNTHNQFTIDAIASYDADARVKCISARVHNDVNFFLNADHFLCTATYEIRFLT